MIQTEKRTAVTLFAASCGLVAAGMPGDAYAGGKPLFKTHTVVLGDNYTNVCGSPAQLPILEQNGQGIGIIDYDGDGLVDLFVPNGSTESRWRQAKNPGGRLFKNHGEWRFTDVTDEAGLRSNAWSNGVAVADFDSDGDFDIYMLNWGPNVLYRNNGDGTFSDVTTYAGVGDPRWSSSAAFADFNGDAMLDIYVSNYVHFDFDDYPTTEKNGGPCMYRNIKTGCGPWCYRGERDTLYINVGNGRFEDRSKAAGLACTEGFRGFGVVAADLDADGDVDVFVACDVMPNLYLENNGAASFLSVGERKGGAFNQSGQHESGMGVAVADFDRSGSLDLVTTNFSGEKNTFYRNNRGHLSDDSSAVGLDRHPMEMGWGVSVQDFNQDGLPDVFVANGHIYPQVEQLADPNDRYAVPPRLYLQNAHGALDEVKTEEAFGRHVAFSLRGCAAADLDNDGDIDLVAIQHNERWVFFENLSNRPAVLLELIDAHGGLSPLGARISPRNGGTHWLLPNQGYQSTNDHRIHIPLPAGAESLELEIIWPGGDRQLCSLKPRPGRVIRLRQETTRTPKP